MVRINKFSKLSKEVKLYILSSILAGIAVRMFETIIKPYLGVSLQFTILQISLIFLISTLIVGNIPEISVISKMKYTNLAMSLIESLSTILSTSSLIIDLYVWVNISPNTVFLLSLLVIIPSIVILSYKITN